MVVGGSGGRRMFSSEFKRFFGYEHLIESTKIKNDDNMNFDNGKMHYLSIGVTSARK